MKLYVCNGTRQVQAFVYRRRIEGSPRDKLITQPIPIGGQIQVSGDLNQYQVDDILDQHRRYGLIPVSEIATGRGLAPLAYQLDAPIDAGKIFRLAARNQGVMVERGKKSRQDAAIVAATNLGRNLNELHGAGLSGDLTELQVDVSEERGPAGGAESDLLQESTVVRPGIPGQEPPQPARRHRRKAA